MGQRKADANGVVYVNPYMRKPVERTLLQTLGRFFWNPEEGKILTRTPKSWGVLGLIYLIMYLSIIVFFYICYCGFYTTIDLRKPKWTLGESIIGSNPGLGHRPIIDGEGTLIWFSRNESKQIEKYVNNINTFLEPYKNKSSLPYKGARQIECSWTRPPERGVESCAVDVARLGGCTEQNLFGYAEGKPCVFIKLNKIFGWEPDVITTPSEAKPDDIMPEQLKSYIGRQDNVTSRQVWMTCFGERPVDQEGIGHLEYYPSMGVPDYFFPYENSPDYLSPLVAVQFVNATRNRVINIRCRGWAKNLAFANSLGFTADRLGSTHLELMID